jgi:hypothetical protein
MWRGVAVGVTVGGDCIAGAAGAIPGVADAAGDLNFGADQWTPLIAELSASTACFKCWHQETH